MESDRHIWDVKVDFENKLTTFEFDIDLQKGEEVIIRSAEQIGVVHEVMACSDLDSVMYLVSFEYASVHIEDAGYDIDCAWFPREYLRKVK